LGHSWVSLASFLHNLRIAGNGIALFLRADFVWEPAQNLLVFQALKNLNPLPDVFELLRNLSGDLRIDESLPE
jgi:hypothetical protein